MFWRNSTASLSVTFVIMAGKGAKGCYAAFFILGFAFAAFGLALGFLPDFAASSSTASSSVMVPIAFWSGSVAFTLPCFT
jgi:hypothetical protein